MYKKYIVRLTAEEREICHETVRRGQQRKGPSRSDPFEDRRTGVDRPEDRGGVLVSEANGREHSPEFCRGRSGAGTEAARDAAGAEDPRRRGGSQGHRHVRGAASERVRQLVVAAAGREGCGVRGLHKPRDGEADAKKNGFSCKRKVQYWVIPPGSDPEFVARMEQVLEIYEKPYDPGASGGLHGRAAGAVGQGDSRTDRRYRGSSATRRLRVRTGGHRVDFHVLRGPVLLAPGNSPQAQDEGGLGRGSRRPAGRPLRGLRKNHLGVRQPSTPTRRERSTKRSSLRGRGSWSSESSSATRRSTGVG